MNLLVQVGETLDIYSGYAKITQELRKNNSKFLRYCGCGNERTDGFRRKFQAIIKVQAIRICSVVIMHKAIVEKVKSKSAKICVVGLGYVGLPTAVFFAENGYEVVGCDINESFVNLINSGKSPLEDLITFKIFSPLSS